MRIEPAERTDSVKARTGALGRLAPNNDWARGAGDNQRNTFCRPLRAHEFSSFPSLGLTPQALRLRLLRRLIEICAHARVCSQAVAEESCL